MRTMPVYLLSGDDLDDDLLLGWSLTDNVVTRNVSRAVDAAQDIPWGDVAKTVVLGPASIALGAREQIVETAKRIAKERVQGIMESFSPGFAQVDILQSFLNRNLVFSGYTGGTSADDAFLRLAQQPEVAIARLASLLADAVANNFPVVNVPSDLIREGTAAAMHQLGLTSAVRSVLAPMVRPVASRLPMTAAALGISTTPTKGGTQVSTATTSASHHASMVRPRVKPWLVSMLMSFGSPILDPAQVASVKAKLMAKVASNAPSFLEAQLRPLIPDSITRNATKALLVPVVLQQASADYQGALVAAQNALRPVTAGKVVTSAPVSATKSAIRVPTPTSAGSVVGAGQGPIFGEQKSALPAKSFNPLLLAPLALLLL